MKTFRIFVVALFCVFAGTVSVVGETITKTYRFSGGSGGSSTTFQGYFYEEGKPNAHYVCFPRPWTITQTANIHATLADGITINLASSTNRIFVQGSSALGVDGDVTLTVGGGTMHNYFIWHVTLYKTNDSTPIDDTNWGVDVESTHSFSKTINGGIFYRLDVTYSTEDIYLIDESSTTISGIEDEYAYTGSSIEPDPVVECNGRTLTSGTHYFVGYLNYTNPGTATVSVEGRSPFHGSVSKNFEIYDPASIPLEWTAGSTIEVTEDYGIQNPISVTGTGNVTLVIADGVTLTAKCGITIADGATLTVEGPGKLKVTYYTWGTTGEDVSTGGIGGTGGTGFAGISGSLIVNGGTVNVTGGDGGFGGTGARGGTGGTGGAGICGSLTVNGGTVNVSGGMGGMGGGGHEAFGGDGGDGGVGISGSLIVNGGTVNVDGGPGGDASPGDYGDGYHGYEGEALGGTVTCTADGYVIQESYNSRTWYNLTSGSICKGICLRVLSPVPITLYDGISNASAIADVVGDGQIYSVTLSGRTLYKDGSWNTLCLPFNIVLAGSPLEGAVVKKMLKTSNLDGNTLTLNFSDDPTIIEAGVPYIVKWEKPAGYDDNPGNFDIQNPVFVVVTFKNADPESKKIVSNDEKVEFTGNYSPKTLEAGEGIYYLGSGNKLYTPSSERTMNSFRACFYVDLSAAQNIKRITLNFGDDEVVTEILEVENFNDNAYDNANGEEGIMYNLAGQRVSSDYKGVVIKNGIKVMK